MPHRQQPVQPGHEPLPIRLMNAIAERFPEIIRITRLERAEEQRHPLQVEHGVADRQSLRDRATRERRRQFRCRRRDDDAPTARPRPPGNPDRSVCRGAATRHPAIQRRRHVVGVPFNLGRCREDFGPGAPAVHELTQPEAGHGGGGTASQPGAQWNLTPHFHLERRRPLDAAERAKSVRDPIRPPDRSVHEMPGQPAAPVVLDVHDA